MYMQSNGGWLGGWLAGWRGPAGRPKPPPPPPPGWRRSSIVSMGRWHTPPRSEIRLEGVVFFLPKNRLIATSIL